MGAQRYDRAVLRGVFLFLLGSDVLCLFKLPEEVQYDSSPPLPAKPKRIVSATGAFLRGRSGHDKA